MEQVGFEEANASLDLTSDSTTLFISGICVVSECFHS
jgi:hypothetical protein